MLQTTLRRYGLMIVGIVIVLVAALLFAGLRALRPANALSTTTFTTTDDFTQNTVVGPDFVPGSDDDGTNGPATSASSLTITDGNVSLVGTLHDQYRVIDGGYYHRLAIKYDGTLWVWGINNDGCGLGCGQLGLGSSVTSVGVPTQVGTDSDWRFISAGAQSSYAVKTDGTLWSWGSNAFGQLGQGDTTTRYVPTQVGSGANWAKISAGARFVTAIKTDGTLWTWGRNSNGQLGQGDTTQRTSPTQVGSGSNWDSLGTEHGTAQAVAIKTDGTLWTWGINSNGQLGQGDTTQRTSPTQVGSGTNWQQAMTNNNTSAAVKTDGTLWTWGQNSNGQLGQGDTTQRTSPTQVGSGTNWAYVNSTFLTTYAIKTDGTLWASGYNFSGALGVGDSVRRTSFTQIGTDTHWQAIAGDVNLGSGSVLATKSDGTLWTWGGDAYGTFGKSPASLMQVLDAEEWTDFSAGSTYYAGVKTDGTLWTWGENQYGQLGQGDTEPLMSPTQVGSATNWQSVSASLYHLLAIKSDGSLWGWGYNGDGELGQGDYTDRLEPVQIGSDTDWSKISAGDFFSLATKTNGELWAWGGGWSGQLGQGDTNDSAVPVQIGVGTNWSEIYAASDFSLAIKSDGTLWAWGDNSYGQLGQGDTTQRTSPTQVGSGTDWSAVSRNASYSVLALKTTGTLWSWGRNTNGQLGQGDTTQRTSPTQVGSGTDWSAVAVGLKHSIALKTDGSLWTWGYSAAGGLGQGVDGLDVDTPTEADSGVWSSIYGGFNTNATLAFKSNDTLWATGLYTPLSYSNVPVQLGSGTTWGYPTTYPSSGTLSGLILHARDNYYAYWSSVGWQTEALPADTSVQLQVRTSENGSTYTAWSSPFVQDIDGTTSYMASLNGLQLPASRYIELRFTLSTDDTYTTPTLTDFTLSHGVATGVVLVPAAPASSGGGGASVPSLVAQPTASEQMPGASATEAAIPLGGLRMPAAAPQLLLDRGTVYLIVGNAIKHGFASLAALKGLGYDIRTATPGSAEGYAVGAVIGTAADPHPPGSWVLSNKTVFYVVPSGLIPVPSWKIFLNNGGAATLILPATAADRTAPTLPLMQARDERVR